MKSLAIKLISFKLQQNAKNKTCMEYTVQMHAWSCRSEVLSRRAACMELQGIGSLVKGQHAWSSRILSEMAACMELKSRILSEKVACMEL